MRRSSSFGVSEAAARLPAKSLIIAYPMWVATRIEVNGAIVAEREPATTPPDPKLIGDALDAGYGFS